MNKTRSYFHLHLVSDSTGETLMTVARAATVQYENVQEIEHVYPLVRTHKQLDRVLSDIEAAPGIVLYTLVDREICERLERTCRELGVPYVNILDPVFAVFQSYLNVTKTHRVGGQHELDAEYFQRIEALNYTMMHDDGQIGEDLTSADIVLVGVSRTSKTPTCIYLANRGIKAANVPLIPDLPIPRQLNNLKGPLVVGLIASAERIQQIRQNRVLSLNSETYNDTYVNRQEIAREITMSRRLCADRGWPLIDVTRRSIEETAAEIMALYRDHKVLSGSDGLDDSDTETTE
ncbi:pyruvate, water dikinase regulatory protein [Roseibium limicola]|uniref:Putative pyruvate, phosphate dikinase regulatory protein n=1 Tax=Roseibium limicola TaxID=2816037 RepID=A0A939ERH6_9HYPH|nr:kinase/pyrophosphorylase [Roseibium limicola]